MRDYDATGDRLDFRGLVADVRHSFRPDYADVLRRAARRRRSVRAAGAAAIAVGLATGGGTAIVATSGERGPTVTPTPTPTPGPWRIGPVVGDRSPEPQPEYTQIAPDGFDVTEPDTPLTGLWTGMMAGDLDHLYLEYQDCAGKDCTRMVAASADGGRTWAKRRMPELFDGADEQTILAVGGEAIVARDSHREPGFRNSSPFPADAYRTSVDGGRTWRQPAIREVDAVPEGWAVFNARETGVIAAVDPETGDIARVRPEVLAGHYFTMLSTPPAAGIWLSNLFLHPASGVRTGRSLDGSVMVSRDGGRTWEQRRLPEAPGTGKLIDSELATADGRTVYAAEEGGGAARVYASADGGTTWEPRASVDLGGPLLSILPTADGALLLEGPKDTYRSLDGGRTFTRVGPSLGNHGYTLATGGYAIPTNNSEYGVWLSPDGAAWSYVSRPEVP